MPQGDLNVANQSGAAFRADLNNQLLALGTLQSGAAEPAPTYAYMLWADTANSLLKQRNSSNNAWITIGTLDQANWGLLTTATAASTYLTQSAAASTYLPLAGGTLTGNLGFSSAGDVSGTACRINIRQNGLPGTFGTPGGAIGITSGTSAGGASTALTMGTVEDSGGAQGFAWLSVSRSSDNNYDPNFFPKYFQFRYGSAEVYRIDHLRRLGYNTASAGVTPLTLLHIASSSATSSAKLLTIDGGNAGFVGSNDANTAYGINFDACAFNPSAGVVQRTGASIEMLKNGTWNESNNGGFGTKGFLSFKVNAGTVAAPNMLERLRLRAFGDINESVSGYPGSDIGFGVAAVLKGDIYIPANNAYTARWTTLAVENVDGGTGGMITSWSDTQGANFYELLYGDGWGLSAGYADVHRLQTKSVSGNGITAFTADKSGAFTAKGPGYTHRPAFFCRAWVNFNMGLTGVAPSIRASGNVSSLTDYNVGETGINFTTAMPDTDYCAVATVKAFDNNTIGSGNNTTIAGTAVRTTSQVRVFASSAGSVRVDSEICNVAVFR